MYVFIGNTVTMIDVTIVKDRAESDDGRSYSYRMTEAVTLKKKKYADAVAATGWHFVPFVMSIYGEMDSMRQMRLVVGVERFTVRNTFTKSLVLVSVN